MPGETARELRQLVEAYDRCWLEGRPQDLRQFLHPDIVFTGPRFQRLAAGIDACVKSYENFIAQAKVHAFKTSDYVIHLADHAAVITYCWMVDYEVARSGSLRSGASCWCWSAARTAGSLRGEPSIRSRPRRPADPW